MRRFELLRDLLPVFGDCLVVSNIGLPSQELHHLGDSDRHFYMLGSLGMCSSIGLGLALAVPRPVLAIDGDGGVLMNLGTLATIAHHAPPNYTLLIVDNGSYGSTGDQPTFTAGRTSLAAVARGAGCEDVVECEGRDAVAAVAAAIASNSPTVVVARVRPGNEKVATIALSPVWIRDRFRRAAEIDAVRP